MDASKLFDPWAQLADMQKWMADNFPSYKAVSGMIPTRYETIDPTVQEIAILAAMHNMASAIADPGEIKVAINAAIAERAKRLTPGS
jgi:hypothetical protein